MQPVGRFLAAIRSARYLSLRRPSERGWRFVYAAGRLARVRRRLDYSDRRRRRLVEIRRCAAHARSSGISFFARRGFSADSQRPARFHLRVVCSKSLEVVRTSPNLPPAVRVRASPIPVILLRDAHRSLKVAGRVANMGHANAAALSRATVGRPSRSRPTAISGPNPPSYDIAMPAQPWGIATSMDGGVRRPHKRRWQWRHRSGPAIGRGIRPGWRDSAAARRGRDRSHA